MTWQSLLDPEIQKFIRDHGNDDVAALALKKPPNADWDYKRILDQIKARQKAKVKLPLWGDHHPDIVFPPANLIEQASSAVTARYKAGLIKGESFADLTGGAGVDSCALTEHYKNAIIVDKDEEAAALIAHNLPLLCLYGAALDVRHQAAEDFIKTMPQVDLAIIDPQRRDHNKKGKFKFEDCAPNILELLPKLLKHAKHVMIKTSPMLDISEGIRALGGANEVHIIEWRGDCKELVFILGPGRSDTPKITAVRLNDNGEATASLSFTAKEERAKPADIAMPARFLYEPGPAFQKINGFNAIASSYGVQKLHAQTHLYTSDAPKTDFPGRIFEIIGQYPPKSEKIPIKQAHITVRNFPENVESLRKKLKIKDGGDDYLFACTLKDGTKTLLHGRKTQNST